jgi:hypothetical protein
MFFLNLFIYLPIIFIIAFIFSLSMPGTFVFHFSHIIFVFFACCGMQEMPSTSFPNSFLVSSQTT